MDMNADLWSRLPFELIERVLSFMPVPELCRLRSVCKGWNELLCKPSFHELCEQNKKQNAFLLVIRNLEYYEFCEIYPGIESSTSLLDLDARRWYILRWGEPFADGRIVQLLTMDEGLVCAMISTAGELDLAISDSITGTRKDLMLPISHNPEDPLPIIVSSADSSTRSFKIFLITSSDECVTCIYLYESSDNDQPNHTQWSVLKLPPGAFQGAALSAVIFCGILYVIVCLGTKYALLKYNLQEDAWDKVKVKIPRKKHLPQLVVNCNRLFLMLWLGESCLQSSQRKFYLSFQVREILVAENSSRMVVQIPKTHLQEMFGEESVNFEIAYAVPFVNAGGLCTSIVLMSTLSGKLISYHPVRGSAILLPAHPQALRQVDEDNYDSPITFYQGKYTNLSLRNLSSQFLRSM